MQKLRAKTMVFKAPTIDFQKYKGMQVAVVKGKVAASGYRAMEVFKKARKKFPKISSQEIGLMSIPREKFVAY